MKPSKSTPSEEEVAKDVRKSLKSSERKVERKLFTKPIIIFAIALLIFAIFSLDIFWSYINGLETAPDMKREFIYDNCRLSTGDQCSLDVYGDEAILNMMISFDVLPDIEFPMCLSYEKSRLNNTFYLHNCSFSSLHNKFVIPLAYRSITSGLEYNAQLKISKRYEVTKLNILFSKINSNINMSFNWTLA